MGRGRASPAVQSSSPSRNAMEDGGPTERTTLGLKENQCLWLWGGGHINPLVPRVWSRTNCSRSAVVLRAGSTAGPLSGGEGVARRPLAAAGGRELSKLAGGRKGLRAPPPPSLPLAAPEGERQLFQSFLPFLETGVG